MDTVQERVLVKLGDHINTDVITPGKYLTSYEDEYLGSICLIDLDPEFPKKMAAGGILIAGKNFGCGSSRETAPIALKAAGVKMIIAEGFARIFYRNALNIGLPCVTCEEAAKAMEEGDEVAADLKSGVIENITKGTTYQGAAIPEELLKQFEMGGLIPWLEQQLKEQK